MTDVAVVTGLGIVTADISIPDDFLGVGIITDVVVVDDAVVSDDDPVITDGAMAAGCSVETDGAVVSDIILL